MGDVNLAGLADDDVIIYDAATGRWIRAPAETMRNIPYPYSYLIEALDPAVQHYDAYKNVGGRYYQLADGDNIVTLINTCMNDIPATIGGAKIFLKAGNYVGTGLIDKPDAKSVTIEGECLRLGGPPYTTRIVCQGVDATDTAYDAVMELKNLRIVSSEEAVTSFLNFDNVMERLINLRVDIGGYATCGIHAKPKANDVGPLIDRVYIGYTDGMAAYIGQDWVRIEALSTYHSNITETTQPILQVGSTSPIDAYAAGTVIGFRAGILHLYTPSSQPDYGLVIQADACIDVLDFEGVTANTALIYNRGSAVHVNDQRGGDAPKMLAAHIIAQNFSCSSFRTRDTGYTLPIDLVTPAVWTAIAPGGYDGERTGYCYIPSGTALAAGITTYDLYNKWTCQGYTKIEIRPQTTLPTGIHVEVYDRDATVANQLRIVVDNTTGGVVNLPADTLFWLKLC